MRVLFLNPATMAFNVKTPQKQPLGGMASSTCYLAVALAERGHDVSLASALPDGTPPMLMGVRHLRFKPMLADPVGFFRKGDYDVVIAINYPEVSPYVKNANPKTINISWLHIFSDQPALKALQPSQRWIDAVVCVSASLRDTFRLSIPTVAIGNAI